MSSSEDTTDNREVYEPTDEERQARDKVFRDYISARSIQQRSYNQFNGRNLIELIDDSTKRWNGYIPPAGLLLDDYQSRIFLNLTRNQIISYLSKVALQRPKGKIKAVNKKTNILDQRFGDTVSDLNKYSLDEENGDARFMEAALEVTTKGTVIVYEGYRREHQKIKVPVKFNPETGQIQYKLEQRTIFDNCFQEVIPLEDFFIANPYQANIQKQPFIIERQITDVSEAKGQYGKYPNWKYVKPGTYTSTLDATTFYRNKLTTDLASNQVEIIKYYNLKNVHTVIVNGVVMYTGPNPFKNGLYPYAKSVFEPYEVAFFWGMPFPIKIMGEQDLVNTFINMMADKTFASLLPFGLSSDLDDLIEDDVLQANKIRKVGDINKWKFDTLPGVSGSEQAMLQMVLGLARENSGDMSGVGGSSTPRGGKITARQLLMKQQEAMQRLGFSMNFLEDLDRDRTKLRVDHILQFYSIPKIEKITGTNGKEMAQMVYRDVRLDNTKLEDGRDGTRVIKLVGDEAKDENKQGQIADELSVIESMGELKGEPTEALAIRVDTFSDYNFSIQIVKNSSYEQNQTLEQAVRHEYAQWRLSLMQTMGIPVNALELVKWVDEAYALDTSRFEAQPQPAGPPGGPQQPGSPPQQLPGQTEGVASPSGLNPSANAAGGLS